MMQKLAENTTPAKGNYKEEYEMQHLPHKLNSEPTEHKHEMLHLPQEELYLGVSFELINCYKLRYESYA